MTTTVGSGLGSSLGSGIETAYGASPTGGISLWNAVDSAPLKLNPTYFDGQGLRGGTLVQDANDHVLVQADAGGPVKLNGYYKGLGRWIATLFGSQTTGIPALVAGTAYQQTHAWQNPWNQSLTLQQGIPDVGGNIHNWMTLGAKVTDGEFTCTNGQSLQATFTVDAQDRFETATAITAPTEPVNDPFFTWRDMSIRIGAYGAETAMDGITKWTGTFKRSFADKRFNVGNLSAGPTVPPYAVKDQPVDNGFSQLTGSLDTEYLSDTLINYFRNTTRFSLIVSFTSATGINGSSNPFQMTFALPCCYLISDDPQVSGPDLVKPSLNYVVRTDETHPVATVTVVSTETTL
jgi:hypothetical protein